VVQADECALDDVIEGVMRDHHAVPRGSSLWRTMIRSRTRASLLDQGGFGRMLSKPRWNHVSIHSGFHATGDIKMSLQHLYENGPLFATC